MSGLKDFLCIMPDHEGAQEKRLAVRTEHLDNARAQNKAKHFLWGGAMVAEHPAPDTVPTFKGSVLVMQCKTADEAWEHLRKDIYTTSVPAELVPLAAVLALGVGAAVFSMGRALFTDPTLRLMPSKKAQH
ncbi:hypothetical protein BCR37DRAFT_393545 [Protomyces lactucae-debilis]|uniref:YCII-related domain-containing protein n=1 Tax=Protomyces lactucae-debilis TaxID=2754530 RepID=A0A1Y2FAF7_PROLT|nr:uncharacterized protein BCR37DRAFT_393545 [Protomyces lactucae-debilis]ORY80900.1 hypothetical protein BCR37DRAFT_393545 [Protomyces lactucae-debilis]